MTYITDRKVSDWHRECRTETLTHCIFDAGNVAFPAQQPDTGNFAFQPQLLDPENLILLGLYSFLEYCICNVSTECYYS